MIVSIVNKAIRIDSHKIFEAPEIINISHIFNDRILILYNPHLLIPEGPQLDKDKLVVSEENLSNVNRNIIMMDWSGNISWRISSESTHYNPWTVVAAEENKPDRWFACTQDGYEYDLNIKNGNVSNPMFMR